MAEQNSKPRPRRKRSWLRRMAARLIMLSISLLITLGICEIVIRIVKPQKLSGVFATLSERHYRINRHGVRVRHEFEDRLVYYRYNDDGLRGGPTPPPTQGTRVLVVGDSFTHGALLEEKDTYVALLQAKADAEYGKGKFAILNAAVGGWGAADYTAYVDDEAAKFKPAAVLVVLNMYDASRAAESQLFAPTKMGDIGLVPQTAPLSRINKINLWMNRSVVYPWLAEHSQLLQAVRGAAIAWFKNAGAQVQAAAPPIADDSEAVRIGVLRSELLYKRLKTWCDTNHVAMWVTTTGYAQPKDAWFGPRLAGSPIDRAFLAKAPGLMGEMGVPYFDVGPAFEQATGGNMVAYTIAGDLHPNEKGDAFIAEHCWPWLKDRLGELPARP